MRQLLVLVALLLIAPRSAGATAQTPEHVLLNGRVLAMFATPLQALLEGREDLKAAFESRDSGLWRGYVGRWAVEGDRLYLVAIEHEVRENQKGTWQNLPLSTVFGKAEGPIPATWYSGTLRFPLGFRRRYVHMGWGSHYARELRVHIVRGVVQRQERVDALHEGRGRSDADMAWCALPSAGDGTEPLPPSDGWRDARALTEVPRGVPFRTRGVLDRVEDTRWTLWIPQTLVTREVRFELRGIDGLRMEREWVHIEIEAVAAEGGAKQVLDVRWVRPLRSGETIHDPALPLPEALLPDADPGGQAEPQHIELDLAREVPAQWDHADLVTLRGPLEVAADGTTTLLGVDVASDPALKGQAVVATGSLAKYEISERLLKVQHPDLAPFRARGPGTYFRLLDPSNEALVTAKPEVAPR